MTVARCVSPWVATTVHPEPISGACIGGNLADGAWTIASRWWVFRRSAKASHSAPAPPTFALKLLPFAEITAGLPPPVVETPQAPATLVHRPRPTNKRDGAGASASGWGLQHAASNASL